ncbi:hypothetical protein ACFV6D_28690 [Kitasatospora sp. NPDC059812]|uniref:hypothetical protein n=1 Tax=Kitasatospora sp. NPDC059812 TaxID=3346958 RepID=UPI003667FF8E
MPTYDTEIATGSGGWQDDQPLTLHIAHRSDTVGADETPDTGTTVTWNSPNSGSGAITFFDDGSRFQGTAQFPDEGPVEYRGTLASD